MPESFDDAAQSAECLSVRCRSPVPEWSVLFPSTVHVIHRKQLFHHSLSFFCWTFTEQVAQTSGVFFLKINLFPAHWIFERIDWVGLLGGFFKGFQVGLCSEKSCCLFNCVIDCINYCQGKLQLSSVASVHQQLLHSQRRCCGNREFKEEINRIKKTSSCSPGNSSHTWATKWEHDDVLERLEYQAGARSNNFGVKRCLAGGRTGPGREDK